MKYLHADKYEDGDNLIIRWCNEIDDNDISNPDYAIATYKIRKIGTLEYYDKAIDVPNSRRTEMGLEPYFYETTDIPVEPEVTETQEGGELIDVKKE